MDTLSCSQLSGKTCVPCEGGVPKFTREEAERQILELPGWELTPDGQRIRRTWVMKNFMAAMRFFNQVAQLAEMEGHHPDLHLERYRHVTIEWWTHAIGGLSENDFICAAKIELIPMELKSQPPDPVRPSAR